MRNPNQDYDLDPAPPEPALGSEPGSDPRSEDQISQIADAWINRRLGRQGHDQALDLARALRGDQRLYRAIVAKLKDRRSDP